MTTRTMAYAGLAIALAAPAAAQVKLAPPNGNGRGYHGWSVAGLPDVTGDGRADIAVGAVGAKTVGEYGGAVQIYSGASGAFVRTLISPIRMHHGRFGWSVSAVPDLDADGFADVAVGAPRENFGTTPSRCGRAYLYSGRTGQLVHKLRSPFEEVNGFFGTSVAGIADVNGDGRGDVVVGAPREDPGASPEDAGRVHIYSGATGHRLRTLVSPTQGLLESFGYSVAAVPDVNGDGRSDIGVGAPQVESDDMWIVPGLGDDTGPGRVYLFSGASGAFLRVLGCPSGEDRAGFGRSVAGVPDVNGDGRGDIVVGAPFDDPGSSQNDAGRAYLFSGATGQLLRKFLPPTNIEGAFFGWSVTGTPDVNGDGRGDIVVGARREGIDWSGRAHVYSGATGVRIKTLFSNSHPNFDGDGYGSSVSWLPDVNGNGRPEIVVGAPFEQWIVNSAFFIWSGIPPISVTVQIEDLDFEGRAYLFKQ